jgi:DNA-binding NarL/FixJ family response regulator
MYKIVIVEDQKIVLDGLASIISADRAYRVVGKMTDASQSIVFLESNEVDLILSDICTENGSNFLDYIAAIKKVRPEIKIIVMTGLPEISFVERARSAGADSFVYKNISTEELLSLIKSTLSGYTTFPNQVKADHAFGDLNEQEIQILRLLCDGRDRVTVSKTLYLSESTVKTYIHNILQKTGFTSIAQLAVFAVSNGLIVPTGGNKG